MSREAHAQKNGRYKTNQEYLHEPARPVKRHFPDKLRAMLLGDLRRMIWTRPYRWPVREGPAPDPESWRDEFEEDD